MHFPKDLLLPIFAFLDYKSITRCSCVCKEWMDALSERNGFWQGIFERDFGDVDDELDINGGWRDKYDLEWKFRFGKPCVKTLTSSAQGMTCLSIAKSRVAYIKGYEGIKCWDLREFKCIQEFCVTGVQCMCFDGDRIVAGFFYARITLMDVASGKVVRAFKGHSDGITSVAFDSENVFSGSIDRSIRVWDVNTGQCVGVLEGHCSTVSSLQIDSQKLVSASRDGTVKVWERCSGQCMHSINHCPLFSCVRFTGNTLARLCWFDGISLWSAETAACLTRLADSQDYATSLQLDHRKIVSISQEKGIKMWDLRTGEYIRTITVPDLVCIDFDKNRLVTGNSEGHIKVWGFH